MHRLTIQRAAEIGVPVINVPGWYDVDDRQTLRLLEAELAGERLPFAQRGTGGASAPATRHFLEQRLLQLEVRRGSRQRSHLAPGIVRRELAPLLAVGVLGLAMLAFVAAGPWIVGTYGYAVLIPGIVASGAITIAATALAPSLPARAGLIVILGLAVVMRLLLVGEEPFLSTDIYRYVWDGRVQAAGINPYAYVPADEALKALRDSAIYPNINRADYAVTAYPPVAQMFFLAVTRISETLTAMRLAMVACEIVIVAVIIDLLRRLRLPVTAVVAWAWHPLAIWEIANNGHVDALMVALMMIGIWLLVRSPALAGAIAVALAAFVKPYAVVVLPAFWRRWDWRMPLAVAGDRRALLSALSRCRPWRARVRDDGLSLGGRVHRRRRILARRARARGRRRGSGPDRCLRPRRTRRHGVACAAQRVARGDDTADDAG